MVIRYTDDPNGSHLAAAAVANGPGNVVGVMPHPERAELDRYETGGRRLLEGFSPQLVRRHPASFVIAGPGTAGPNTVGPGTAGLGH